MTDKNKEVVWGFKAKDDVTPAADDAVQAIDALANAQDRQGQASDEVNAKNKQVTKSTQTLGEATTSVKGKVTDLSNNIKSKAAVAMAAYALSIGATYKGIEKLANVTLEYGKEGQEQLALEQKLADAIGKKAKSIQAARVDYNNIMNTINAFSDATGRTDEELIESATLLADKLNKTKIETKDLALLTNIATKEKKSLEDATKEYIKIAKGDIGALKELTSLSKDQVAELEKIKDGNKRAAAGLAALTKQYGTTTKAIDAERLAIIKANNAKGDLRQQLGKVISQSGIFSSILGPIHDQMRLIEKDIGANAKEYKQLALVIAQNVIVGLRGMYEIGWGLIETYQNFDIGLTGLKVTMKSWSAQGEVGALKVADAMLTLADEALEDVSSQFDKLLKYSEQLARFTGADAMADSFAATRKEIKGMNNDMDALRSQVDGKLKKAQEDYNKTVADGRKEVEDTIKSYDKINAVGKKIDATFNKVLGKLNDKRLSATNDLGPKITANTSPGTTPTAPTTPTGDGQAKAKAQEIKDQAELAKLDAQILKAKAEQNKAQVLALEYSKAKLQAEQSAGKITDDNLRQLTKANELEKARQDFQAKSMALQKEQAKEQGELIKQEALKQSAMIRLAAFKETDETQRRLLELEAQRVEINATMEDGAKRQLALMKLQREEQGLLAEKEAERFAMWQEALGSMVLDSTVFDVGYAQALNEQAAKSGELTQAQNDALRDQIELRQEQARQTVKGINATIQLTKAIQAMSKSQWDFHKAQEATLGALQAGVQVTGALTGLFVKDQKKRAKISVGINAAAAAGAYALFAETLLPNYLTAGIQYTSAAVQYATIAGASASTGSRPSVTTGSQQQAPERSQAQVIEATTSSLAEKLADSNRARGDVMRVYDFRAATFVGDDPEAMEQFGALMAPVIDRRTQLALEDREL